MKVESQMIDGKIYFKNFVVVKESDTFYGVYQRFSRHFLTYNKNFLVTSATTIDSSCKKAKLLQMGYDMALDDYE